MKGKITKYFFDDDMNCCLRFCSCWEAERIYRNSFLLKYLYKCCITFTTCKLQSKI